MDIEEFEKRTPPRAKRSRLEPFRAQILELKAKNYADWQVKDWLAENGLNVSRQAVQQYVKKHQHAISTTPTQTAPAPLGHDQKPATPAPQQEPAREPQARITNPADIRKARRREIDLEDLSDQE